MVSIIIALILAILDALGFDISLGYWIFISVLLICEYKSSED